MGRLLGIDYGEARTGLALSDPSQLFATPLVTLASRDKHKLMHQIEAVVQDKQVEKVVVGIPTALSGRKTKQTERVIAFTVNLKAKLSVPVAEFDERLSSFEAHRILHQKGVKTGHHKGSVDKMAAALILQTYLDAQKSKSF